MFRDGICLTGAKGTVLPEDQLRRYRNTNDGLIVLFWIVAVPLVLTLTILSSEVFDEGWGILFTIFIGLGSAGTAMEVFDTIRRKRTEGEYAMRFPGYAGARIPIFDLLRYEDPSGAIDFAEPDCHYSLGEAAEVLFLLKNKRVEGQARVPPGKLVLHPTTFRPIVLALPEIADVRVIERSDEEIAASAVDRRDYADKLGSAIAQRVTGTRIKTKITPFGAYVAVTARGDAGETFMLAAIPTDVSAEAMNAMGDLAATDDFTTPWLVSKGIDQAKSIAIEEMDHRATDLLGKPVTDVVHAGADLDEQVTGYVDEVKGLIDPDAATIATTAGGRARHMAQLIGLRLRKRAGSVA